MGKINIVEERYYIGSYELFRKTNNGTLEVERSTVHITDDQKRIAQIDNDGTTETIRYQYDNHLGSASLELDETAAIISYEEYHPFGTTSYRSGRTETETSLKRYKYVGKERDEETGLYYYGARYYASWIARFVSVDPLAHERSWVTPYNYCQNNPINRIDPTGALDDDPQQTMERMTPKSAGALASANTTEFKLKQRDGYIEKISGKSAGNLTPENSSQNKLGLNFYNKVEKVGDELRVGNVFFKNKETMEIVFDAMQNDRAYYEKVLTLSQSEMKYCFNWTGQVDLGGLSKNKKDSATGGFDADRKEGYALINFETYKNGTELGPLTGLYHETQHGIQFDKGEIGFIKIGGKWGIDSSTYDILDEVDAFEAGYNSPGYRAYHRDEFMKLSLSQKADFISGLSPRYKNAFTNYGINSMPPIYNKADKIKTFHKTENIIRFVWE
ncbi:MAG: RHS repeat-associated core domain-containing protein [Salinivirgaceae bacterium]|nr:RHS repeat-associated core domain-containing protein [Salinivirgaceae bacterium]